ncbi:MAG: response regulator [Elusimicrobia bacterium]|nr:response regulator [Elusimicrobiota bacterium]
MKKKILVVDDDPAVRSLIRRALAGDEYEIIEAADGSETGAIIRKERPALVLPDIHMPKFDGIAVVEDIRRDHPGIVVVVISGDVSEIRAKLALERRTSDFLPKPLDIDCLKTCIEANLIGRD